MRVLLEKVVLGRPEVVESALVDHFRLLEQILEQHVLRVFRPRPRKLMQKRTPDFHGPAFRTVSRRVFYVIAPATQHRPRLSPANGPAPQEGARACFRAPPMQVSPDG